MSLLAFPTTLHQQVARRAADFFAAVVEIDTVLVVNSCARGRAIPDSDLDMAILVTPATPAQRMLDLEAAWQTFASADPAVREFRRAGQFTGVHLDVFDGRFEPAAWDDGGGPDMFEVEIGNRVAAAVPIDQPGPWFQAMQARWLPYYDDDLRASRLSMVREACASDLARAVFLSRRGLGFGAFDYHYKAFREFLQAVFIARRTYPLSYTKWIKEQVAERLALPELYRELPPLLSVRAIEGTEVADKALALQGLLERWSQV